MVRFFINMLAGFALMAGVSACGSTQQQASFSLQEKRDYARLYANVENKAAYKDESFGWVDWTVLKPR
jgi:hypothetical protein